MFLAIAQDIHVSPDGRFVYGSNRVKDAEGQIVIFSIDQDSGELTLVGHEPCGGITPRNFALHPSGDWMLVANNSKWHATSSHRRQSAS